ncbi:MAG: M20/M25/M40 family metallo-hydrolase [Candidatus Coatesbacteria bacterium]|nr:MAG: M20/M25/M40 family metallo-hydrolase [Candidatus Coatesbacteria bacterium]
MRPTLITALVLPVFFHAIQAYASPLPGDYLVYADDFVEPDDRGVWYLGGFNGGHLYLCIEKRTRDFDGYVILDVDPETAIYFTAFSAPYAAIESARVLAEPEPGHVLVRVEPADADRFRRDAVLYEVKRLLPVKRTPELSFAEPPPEYNEEIAAAITGIGDGEIMNHLNSLQDFGTRYSYTDDCILAAEWLAETLGSCGLSVTLDIFFGSGVDDASAAGDGENCWISGSDGKIFYTADGGTTWNTAITGTKERLWSISMLDEFAGFAVGSGGTVLRTVDGGNWTAVQSPVSDWIFGIDFADYENGCVVCDRGTVLYTSDGGETWDFASSPAAERLYDISYGTDTVAWAVGRGGTILKTVDKGVTWLSQESGTDTRLYGIEALDAYEAWAVGWEGTVLYTDNGGSTWEPVSVVTDAYLYDVEFINKDIGFVCGSDGTVLKTTDGGSSWDYLATPGDFWYSGMSFIDADIGYVVGDNSILKTTGNDGFVELADNFDDKWTNVIGEKQGETNPDEIVIVCAHYDSISDDPYNEAPGADDNASGTAAVLAAANALSDLPTERTIEFVCFAGEEQGLLGSRHYADKLATNGETVIAVVNLDMVAYAEDENDDTSLFSNQVSTWLGDYYLSCHDLYKTGLTFDHFVDDEATGSDHSSFWDAGYAAIFLIEGEEGVGGIIDYPYYHTTEDTVDKLTIELNTWNARAAAATVAHLARYYEDGDGPDEVLKPIAYPNPVRLLTGDTGVTFDRLTAPSTIQVYTITGEIVFETTAQNETVFWNLTALRGGHIASGVYIWRVTSDARTTTGKLAVIK